MPRLSGHCSAHCARVNQTGYTKYSAFGDTAMQTRTTKVSLVLGFLCILVAAATPALAQTKPASSIPTADLIQPADLAAQLQKSSAPKPVILHVGFRKLYAQAHIPNSDYIGPGGDDDGLKSLRERAAKIPKDSAIVIYCGCCPWSRCPNIAAAYDQLRALGFTQVKVLYIADNFGSDWVDKGYPVLKGS
jgi:thiosulfate/3-mercaptopyruvate sulfurtransferase